MDQVIDQVLKEMLQKHGCHTVILYGSRSRGDWTQESDVDVIGIRKDGEKFRDARVISGVFLDAFIYPEADVLGREKEFLRLRNAKILIEKDGFGTDLLKRVDEVFLRGPEPLPEDELQVRRVWIDKMLARVSKGDIEGNYRRAWLQVDLLENYFALRGLWYLGPKESFRWLSQNSADVFSAFEAALRPDSSQADLKYLVQRVLDC